eukprot:CAMPEP_0179107612 /NCGR_PEP_ID=MMETSP0796-20121207/50092_1 /TAXON_ID=73915 /ORGANISM="Pyrodinium bahamense, Strain pbaha01" /LENGTH=124 /DNA_ID=CAMNT_0020805673 /DNA_START=275 /DNA_END=649 /DNA_ORIENTATION=+
MYYVDSVDVLKVTAVQAAPEMPRRQRPDPMVSCLHPNNRVVFAPLHHVFVQLPCGVSQEPPHVHTASAVQLPLGPTRNQHEDASTETGLSLAPPSHSRKGCTFGVGESLCCAEQAVVSSMGPTQ